MEEVARSKGIDRMLRDEEDRLAREAKVRRASSPTDVLDSQLIVHGPTDPAARCARRRARSPEAPRD